MGSPLSFDATENFRRSLLIRNLPPYEDWKSDDSPGTEEFFINDIGVQDPGNVNDIGDEREILLKTLNKYGPEGSTDYGDVVQINLNNQSESNQGEYDYYSSEPNIDSEQSQILSYLQNYYGPEDGYKRIISIEDIQRTVLQRREYFKFIFSTYSPFNLLTVENPTGDNGLLSQDSTLARVAATKLRELFLERVVQETYQQTWGNLNLIDASQDPFDALSILLGKETIIERDWHISVPGNIIGKGLDFISRISGIYSPYSWIPGDYFGEDKKSYLNQAINTVTGLFDKKGKLELPTNKKSSDIFLANTGKGQTKSLFSNLEYNKFRPDYKANFIGDLNLGAPKGEYYIGSRTNDLSGILNSSQELPYDEYGNKIRVSPVGVWPMSKEYEGETVNNAIFGLKSYSYYNNRNSLMGGFGWISQDEFAYTKPGKGNSDFAGSVTQQDAQYWTTESRGFEFKKGSILDDTQKLVDAADGSSNRLQHVGNAISQVSKVFHDGIREITKGSAVLNYVDSDNTVVAQEYCRVFTKDLPYVETSDLQKSSNGVGNNYRKFSYSILDDTYNLNIAPWKAEGNAKSTNIQDDKVKKYMFSIENLAWRTSNKQGFTYQDLPHCERGPNGGRVMWFPPYDINFSEQNSVNWTTNEFLGRPEPIYTYNNTSRQGSLSWKILVDHPSVMNAIVDKELKNISDNETANGIVDSFIAGCRKYDLYEMASKYEKLKPKDIYDIIEKINYLTVYDDIETITGQTWDTRVWETRPKEPVTNTYEEKTTTEDWSFTFYFDDDVPGPKDSKINEPDENLDYITVLNNYIGRRQKYIETCPSGETQSVETFFDEILTGIEGKAQELANKISSAVNDGAEISITFAGGASPTASDDYNRALANRRVNIIRKYLFSLKDEKGKSLSDYENKIKTTFSYYGESFTATTAGGDTTFCADGPTTGNEKEYSLIPMWCRGVIIEGLEERKIPGEDPNQEIEYEEILVGGDTGDTRGIAIIQKPREVEQKTKKLERKKDIAKIILKKLLNECDYFYQMDQNSPIVYNGIKEKFKYFNPAFHSITPEGLNSRLTFLQQCLRPGDTIPVIGDDGTPRTDDAKNTSFGAPPICVLRIGDFYHTKIAINQMSVSYEPITFDLNPEGIGVQPMIANITMSFYFIGGQGLKEPVERLQNALSFNYYANTEMYDERAVATDTESLKKINEELWRQIEDETGLGLDSRNDEGDTSEGGNTIGTILETTIFGETFSGTTSYKNIVNELIDKTKNYVDVLTKTIENICNEESEILMYYVIKNRKYKYGQIFNYFDQQNSETTSLFGKSIKYEELLTELEEKLKEDVENGTSPFVDGIDDTDFKRSEKKLYKRRINDLIDDQVGFLIQSLQSVLKPLYDAETELIRVIDKINLVSSDTDGYRIKSGKNVIYNISATDEVHESSSSPDTKEEMKKDIQTISEDLILVRDRMEELFNEGSFSGGFLEGDFDTPEHTRLCTVLYESIRKNPSYVSDFLLGDDLSEKTEWVKYVNEKVYGRKEQTMDIGDGSEFDDGTNTIVTTLEAKSGLVDVYNKLGTSTDKKLKEFKNSDEISKFESYSPFSKDKIRKYTYIQLTTETMDSNKDDYFNKTYSGVNGGSPSTFNYKRTLN